MVSHAGVSKNGRVPVHMAEEIRMVDLIWELDLNSQIRGRDIMSTYVNPGSKSTWLIDVNWPGGLNNFPAILGLWG